MKAWIKVLPRLLWSAPRSSPSLPVPPPQAHGQGRPLLKQHTIRAGLRSLVLLTMVLLSGCGTDPTPAGTTALTATPPAATPETPALLKPTVPPPTAAPTAVSTVGMTVAEYAEWCAAADDAVPDLGSGEVTWKQLRESADRWLEDARNVDAPPPLSEWHQERVQATRAFIAALKLQQLEDDVQITFAEMFAAAMIASADQEKLKAASEALAPEIRQQLLDTGCLTPDEAEATPTPTLIPLVTDGSELVVTAPQLAQAFRDHQPRAERDYVGKVVSVTGVVKGFDGSDYVTLDAPSVGNDFSHIQGVRCHMQPAVKAALADMDIGQQVTLQGRVRELYVSVVDLDDCQVLPTGS